MKIDRKMIQFIVAGIAFYILSFFVPPLPLDPWGLVNLNKFFELTAALLMIQILSFIVLKKLKGSHGFILTGFFGGLISSTAMTARVAHHKDTEYKSYQKLLIILSSHFAMLVQSVFLILLTLKNTHLNQDLIKNLSTFLLLPTLCLIFIIGYYSYQNKSKNQDNNYSPDIDFSSTFKLVIMIMGILVLNKGMQKYFGDAGVETVTFLVSFFEVHGSIISNTQLLMSDVISQALFIKTIGLSLIASTLSKVLLVFIWSDQNTKKHYILSSLFFILTIVISYLL